MAAGTEITKLVVEVETTFSGTFLPLLVSVKVL